MDTYFSQSRRAPSVVVVVAFVFVFSRRRGGGEEEEEGEEAPNSTFQKCREEYSYGVCVPSFLPFFSFLFFPAKNTNNDKALFKQQHPSKIAKKSA